MRIGDRVPGLELKANANDEIEDVRLIAVRGTRLIMVFRPADFTFVCPTELEEIAKRCEKLRAEGAERWSVSTGTVFVREHGEAICPVKGEPGGVMRGPGLDRVGKI